MWEYEIYQDVIHTQARVKKYGLELSVKTLKYMLYQNDKLLFETWSWDDMSKFIEQTIDQSTENEKQ